MELDSEKRALLAFVLTIVVLIVWARFFTPKRPAQEVKPEDKKIEKAEKKPEAEAEPAPGVAVKTPPGVPAVTRPRVEAKDVSVETPLYVATFTELGGRLKSLTLKNYKESIKPGSPPKELVAATGPEDYPLGVGFASRGSEPFDNLVFKAETKEKKLTLKKGKLSLDFVWEVEGSIRMEKTFTFRPDSYLIGLTHKITNLTDAPWRDSPLITYKKSLKDADASRYIFEGPVAYQQGEGLEEIKPKKVKEPKTLDKVFWAGYVNQYFFSSMLPPEGKDFRARLHYSGGEEKLLTVSLIGEEVKIPAKKSVEVSYDLFFGPKDLKVLGALGRRLKEVVDFGFFDIVAKPLLYFMNFLNRYINNYGLAIIIVTLLIKAVFWPLTHKSYESMRVMKKLQPKLKELKEKYKDDKAKMNQEMMGLYRAYNVNPMSGCLPMLLQVPIFFAFYRMLYSAIELRHAPFMLWVNDLSAPDRLPVGFDIPYLHGLPVLTLLMGASMFIQQKMTPMSGDPAQQKIFMFMPLIFTILFVNFPAGLTLYWLVNNVLSIVQQHYINKKKE